MKRHLGIKVCPRCPDTIPKHKSGKALMVAKLIEATAERVTIPTDKQSPFA
jgi:hypothetical protein